MGKTDPRQYGVAFASGFVILCSVPFCNPLCIIYVRQNQTVAIDIHGIPGIFLNHHLSSLISGGETANRIIPTGGPSIS